MGWLRVVVATGRHSGLIQGDNIEANATEEPKEQGPIRDPELPPRLLPLNEKKTTPPMSSEK